MTICASHIEQPTKTFKVSFERATYFNVFQHEAESRTVNVLAETEAGAIAIAQYHWATTGYNFRLES